MVVEKPANYDQPQTVNDELLIPAQVGQEVQLEPGTDEPINIEMTEEIQRYSTKEKQTKLQINVVVVM